MRALISILRAEHPAFYRIAQLSIAAAIGAHLGEAITFVTGLIR